MNMDIDAQIAMEQDGDNSIYMELRVMININGGIII